MRILSWAVVLTISLGLWVAEAAASVVNRVNHPTQGMRVSVDGEHRYTQPGRLLEMRRRAVEERFLVTVRRVGPRPIHHGRRHASFGHHRHVGHPRRAHYRMYRSEYGAARHVRPRIYGERFYQRPVARYQPLAPRTAYVEGYEPAPLHRARRVHLSAPVYQDRFYQAPVRVTPYRAHQPQVIYSAPQPRVIYGTPAWEQTSPRVYRHHQNGGIGWTETGRSFQSAPRYHRDPPLIYNGGGYRENGYGISRRHEGVWR